MIIRPIFYNIHPGGGKTFTPNPIPLSTNTECHTTLSSSKNMDLKYYTDIQNQQNRKPCGLDFKRVSQNTVRPKTEQYILSLLPKKSGGLKPALSSVFSSCFANLISDQSAGIKMSFFIPVSTAHCSVCKTMKANIVLFSISLEKLSKG